MAAPAARTAPAAPDAGEDAGRAGDAHSRGPAGAVPDIANDLADMLRRGRVGGGVGVSSVEFRMTDGRRVYLELPAPVLLSTRDDATASGSAPLSDLAREILDALGQTPDEWAFGEEVCRRIGGEATTNRSYYRAVDELKEAGLVESNNRRGIRLK